MSEPTKETQNEPVIVKLQAAAVQDLQTFELKAGIQVEDLLRYSLLYPLKPRVGMSTKKQNHELLGSGQMSIRVGAADRAELEQNARMYGVNLSEYIRWVLGNDRVRTPLFDADKQQAIVLALSHLQGDSRQVASALNQMKFVRGVKAEQVQPLIKKYNTITQEILKLKHYVITNAAEENVTRD